MSTSQIGTVLDAIRAGLVNVSALTGVAVYSGFVSLEEGGLECIEFGKATLQEEPNTMGGNKLETWDVEFQLIGSKPWQGDTETTIKAARDRALALFAAVETYINDTYTGSLPDAEITAGSLESGYGPEQRACLITGTLTIRYVKNP